MKYYYKLINNETNEIESYVESSECTRPERRLSYQNSRILTLISQI